MTTRRKFGMGIAAILAAQRAPAALVRSLVAGRHIAATGTRLPYDAEVEYLESTGTQWIETGIYGNDTILVKCGWSYRDSSSYYSPFGTRTSLASRAFAFSGSVTNGIYINYSTSARYLSYSGKDVYAHEWEVQLGKDGSSWYSYLAKDGALVSSSTGAPTAFSTELTIPLFAYRSNSGILTFGNGGQRIKFFQVKQGSEIVLDLFAVRFTNSLGQTEGAMYDRVSGQLFRNAGTGAFVIGPVKARGASGQNGGGISG